jgi:Kef-type K+ transport system membrane component KefB
MELFVVIPVVLIIAFAMGSLFKKVGLPPVVGQILAGVILGIPLIRGSLFDESSIVIINFLAYLGIIFMLFMAGLEIDIDKIKETSHESILLSLSSAMISFGLGFVFLIIAFPEYGLLTTVMFAGALMVTSEATNVVVLLDLNSLKTRIGSIIMGAGALDEIFVVLFLAFLAVIGRGGGLIELAAIPLQLAVFAMIVFIFFKLATKLFHHHRHVGGKESETFALMIIFVMVLAGLSEVLGLGFLLGAIAGGFILQISLKGPYEQQNKTMTKVTQYIALGFFIPFFFANVGLNFELFSLIDSLPLIVGTIAIAFLGKMLGCLIVKPFSDLSIKQLYYIGWAMNSRGAAELVIALAARQLGLIPLDVFSALVAMSIVTTIIFPIVLAKGIKKNPRLMDIQES